jgi:hypothetical protein
MSVLLEETKKRFLGSLLDDVLGYWRIYDRLKLKVLAQTGDKRVEFSTENEFWYSILGDRFSGSKPDRYINVRSGQVVRFKNCFASEWVPKLPGRLWTNEGAQDLKEGLRRVAHEFKEGDQVHVILDPYAVLVAENGLEGVTVYCQGSRCSPI